VLVRKGWAKPTPKKISTIMQRNIKELLSKTPIFPKKYFSEELTYVRSRLPKLAKFIRSRACFTRNIS
jgi:hypothetical protein